MTTIRATRSGDHDAVRRVVEAGGEVVGHVGPSRSRVDARERLLDVLVLSPPSVAPGHQSGGLGDGLVAAPTFFGRHAFEHAGGRGFVRQELGP